jgi:hypothetical protein
MLDRRADLKDLARAFMADHAGRERRERPVHRGEVAVADAGRPDPDANVVRAGIDRRHVVAQFQLVVTDRVKYGRSHQAASSLEGGDLRWSTSSRARLESVLVLSKAKINGANFS